MKNFIKVFGLVGGFLVLSFFNKDLLLAKEALRAQDAIVVDNGRVAETGILADSDGQIFLEFSKDMHVSNALDKQPFIGEILPPQILEMDWKKPRGRMNELLTFEILSDASDELVFVDKFSLIRPKEKIRLEYESPDGFLRMGGFQLFTKILVADKIGLPGLWQYLGEDVGWKRLGGKMDNSAEDGVKIFSASLTKTGIYTIFDENPAPTYSEIAEPSSVELVEESPYPSVLTPSTEASENSMEADFEASMFEENNDFSPENGMEERFSNEELIPAIEPVSKELLPTDKTNDSVSYEDDLTNSRPAPSDNLKNPKNTPPATENLPDRLPTAGVIESKNSFPFLVIFAFGILGMSVYLGFAKRY